MNKCENTTISVQGNSRVCRRPSSLILLGRILKSAPTLELALKSLNQKREAVSRWLEGLDANDIEFGEPRFPDQVEPNPMRIAQKMTQQRLGQLAQENTGKRSVLTSYMAQWPITDKSSGEMLVLVDRIQFEAADLQESEGEVQRRRPSDRPSWETDPMQELESRMSVITTPSDGDEIHFLFLSSLPDAQHEEALVDAFRDGRAKGSMTARAAGMELDQLQCARWSTSGASEVHGLQRQMYLPLLAETPLKTGPNQLLQESPRTAEFDVSVHLTFTLK